MTWEEQCAKYGNKRQQTITRGSEAPAGNKGDLPTQGSGFGQTSEISVTSVTLATRICSELKFATGTGRKQALRIYGYMTTKNREGSWIKTLIKLALFNGSHGHRL